MTVRFDEDVVLAKVSTVKRCVEAIRSLESPERSGVEEWIRRDVTVLNLQRAVEALIDLASHLVASNGWELPRDGAHAFQVLAERGVVSASGATVARRMIGFRNVAVHEYAALDPRVVEGIARDRLGDLEGLANGILARLAPAR